MTAWLSVLTAVVLILLVLWLLTLVTFGALLHRVTAAEQDIERLKGEGRTVL